MGMETTFGSMYTQALCKTLAICNNFSELGKSGYLLQVKAGKVYATATEDMDALTFGSNILLRHMTFSEAKKMPVQEIHLNTVLEGLELTQKEVSN